jgi:hypothetical protein
MSRRLGMVAGKSRRPIYVGKGNHIATTGSAVVQYPAGIMTGDQLVLVCQQDQSDNISTPAGWTLLASVTSTECDLRVYTKAHTTGTNLSISWSGDHIVAQVLAFRDVNAVAPVNASQEGNSTSISGNVAIPGVTTTVPDCLVLAMIAHDAASTSSQLHSWANDNLSEGTELTDVSSNVGWDGGFAVHAGYKLTAGATGTTTATLSTPKKKAYFTMALAPA